jgi:GSH-dependent disulfide-bond oxidoreductase
MIDLYAMYSPNAVRIFIALEEFGLRYQVKPIDVFSGQQFDPEFRKLNPIAKVPIIVDHDGPDGKPYTVFESAAIMLYLADKTGKLLPNGKAAHFEAVQWLIEGVTALGPMCGQYFHFLRFAPPGNDYSVSRYRTQVTRVFDVAEERLGKVSYLGGAEFSIADIAWLPWARFLPFLLGPGAPEKFPEVTAWAAKLSARPAAVKALAAVDAMSANLTQLDGATPEVLDKLFGRGNHAAAA